MLLESKLLSLKRINGNSLSRFCKDFLHFFWVYDSLDIGCKQDGWLSVSRLGSKSLGEEIYTTNGRFVVLRYREQLNKFFGLWRWAWEFWDILFGCKYAILDCSTSSRLLSLFLSRLASRRTLPKRSLALSLFCYIRHHR